MLNWPELLLRLRLAADQSIFQSGWLVLFVLAMLLFFTATVHELGHLLAGFFVRFHFQVLVVGPVRISRLNGRLQMQRQQNSSLFNGLAASLPKELDNLARRLLYFAMGGPLASLLLSLVTVSVALLIGNELTIMLEYLWLWECCLFLAVASYFFLLTSLRPSTYQNGLVADGGRILMLLSHSPEAKRWQALVMLYAADCAGKRPLQWDGTLLNQALIQPDDSHDYLSAVVMNYHHWLDKGQLQKAEAYLEEAFGLPVAWASGMRARLALEKAYFAAYHHKDMDAATELFGQVKIRRRENDPLYRRAEAALFLLEGAEDAAAQSVNEGLSVLNSESTSGLQIAQMDWMQLMIN